MAVREGPDKPAGGWTELALPSLSWLEVTLPARAEAAVVFNVPSIERVVKWVELVVNAEVELEVGVAVGVKVEAERESEVETMPEL